jgi:hypothetical protein
MLVSFWIGVFCDMNGGINQEMELQKNWWLNKIDVAEYMKTAPI